MNCIEKGGRKCWEKGGRCRQGWNLCLPWIASMVVKIITIPMPQFPCLKKMTYFRMCMNIIWANVKHRSNKQQQLINQCILKTITSHYTPQSWNRYSVGCICPFFTTHFLWIFINQFNPQLRNFLIYLSIWPTYF